MDIELRRRMLTEQGECSKRAECGYRMAIENRFICLHMLPTEPLGPAAYLDKLIAAENSIALDPSVSEPARALAHDLYEKIEKARLILAQIVHATAPTPDDGGGHENAYTLAVDALAVLDAPQPEAKLPWPAVHLKTGAIYRVTGERINTNNTPVVPGAVVVDYERNGLKFSRSADEFVDKFKAV